MPIRKRGISWQIDVRVLGGARIRRNYPSKAEAEAAAAALTPTPQQRAAARRRVRNSSPRKKS